MGFKNLKEILLGMQRSEIKKVMTDNIENDLSTTMICLTYDTMVSTKQSLTFVEKSLHPICRTLQKNNE